MSKAKATETRQNGFDFAPPVPPRRRPKVCKCSGSSAREERSPGGAVLAVICGNCTLPVASACSACGGKFSDLRQHFRLTPVCFRKADPWGWQEAEDKK